MLLGRIMETLHLQHSCYLMSNIVVPQGHHVLASVDDSVMYKGKIKHSSTHGFVALGTDAFGYADFDNLAITAS